MVRTVVRQCQGRSAPGGRALVWNNVRLGPRQQDDGRSFVQTMLIDAENGPGSLFFRNLVVIWNPLPVSSDSDPVVIWN